MNQNTNNDSALPHRRSLFLVPLKAAALLLAVLPGSAKAGEVAAFAKVYSWPDGVNNFGTYTKAPGGTLTPTAAGNGWKSHASASFHALAAGGSATTPGTGSFGRGYVGGSAYWFEQITISSPTVAVGTQGRANLTLYFDGEVSAESQRNDRENKASISYRVASNGAGENVATPNVGDGGGYSIYRALGYGDSTGQDFRNQPREHVIYFNFGQPCDLTIAVHTQAEIYRDAAGKVRAELRCSGWNGLHDIRFSNDTPVTNATITSQTGFNYANPGTTTYAQWASLYQLPAAAMLADTNNNGLTDQMEYALGLNPRALNSGAPLLPGTVRISGQDFASFTYTRPRLGSRPGDLTYLPQCSTNLADWTAAGLVTTVAPSATQTETVTVRSTQPVTTQNREFLRLDIVQP